MPWVYVEDWSLDIFINQIASDLPHEDTLLKVFAMKNDPRGENVFNDPKIFTEQVSGEPFSSEEIFVYGDRTWTGAEIEQILTDTTNCIFWENARALLRFSNTNGFTLAAMMFQVDGSYRFNHPMEVLDGLHLRDERSVHLDIFFPESVRALTILMTFSESSEMSDMMKGSKWRRMPRFSY